jgi:hypothetical protein
MRAFSMSVESCGTKAHFATPYRGQSKPIERAFRTVIELFSRGQETYTGSNKESSVVPIRSGVRLDGIDYYNEQTAPDERKAAAMAQDEEDYLSDGSPEPVRRVINDEAQTGVALAELPHLKYKLENLRNDHQQLTSRVGALPEVKRLAKSDAVKVIEGVWQGLAPAAFLPRTRYSRRGSIGLVNIHTR